MENVEQKPEPRVAISKKLVIINTASTVGARLLNVFVLVWMYQYLLTRIPAEEFAIYPVITAVMIFAPLFSTFLAGGVARHAVEAYARGEEERVSEIVSSIFPVLTAGGFVFLAAGMAFAWYIDSILEIPPALVGEARTMMALLVVGFVVQFTTVPFSIGFQIRQRFVLLSLITVCRDLFRIALLLALLLGVSTRVLWVVVATVSAEMIGVLVVLALSQRMVPALRFRPSRFSAATARWVVSFGMWTTLSKIAAMIRTGAAPIVLNKLSTGLEVTAFHIGAMFEKQINVMTAIGTGPLQPTLTAMHATGENERLGNTFMRGGRYALWVNLLAACPLAIYSTEIIRLYVGDVYMAAATVMALLFAKHPVTAGTTLLISVAMAKAQVKLFNAFNLGAQLVSLCLMIVFAGPLQMGAVGVALAAFSTMVTTHLLIFLPLGLRIADVSFTRFLKSTLVPGLLPAMAGSAGWGGLKLALTPDSWLDLALCGFAGFLVYVGVLIQFALQADERRDLKRLMEKGSGALRKIRTRAT